MEHLDASANRLVTLGDLGRTNPGLLSLDASDNSLVSIAGLRGCKALPRLSLRNNNIRDVDVAMETADLTRNSIMQQAATSILQQANVQPQIALSLLQG